MSGVRKDLPEGQVSTSDIFNPAFTDSNSFRSVSSFSEAAIILRLACVTAVNPLGAGLYYCMGLLAMAEVHKNYQIIQA